MITKKQQQEVDKFVCSVKNIDYLKSELTKYSIDFYKKPKTDRWGRKWHT